MNEGEVVLTCYHRPMAGRRTGPLLLCEDPLEFIRRCIRERKVYWTYHVMKCRICGRILQATTTDLPFKVSERTIVILKHLPVAQCEGCSEYLIADAVFAKVEELLSKVDTSVEREIIPCAA